MFQMEQNIFMKVRPIMQIWALQKWLKKFWKKF